MFKISISKEGTLNVYSLTLRGVWLNLLFGTTQVVRMGGRVLGRP
jgi:hypothetical protein